MFFLFSSYYDVRHPASFFEDLDRKDHVFLLKDNNRVIRGFSTLSVSRHRYEDRDILVLFSGDTIIHPDYWGSAELPRVWIRTTLDLAEESGLESYWLLISGGQRTYRYLPLFCKEFYPSVGGNFAGPMRALRDFLAAKQFGDCYDPASGIVRFEKGATPLKPGIGGIEEARLKNPHISFFAKMNPGHAEGDELVCLAPLHSRNLTAAARRVLEPAHGPRPC